MAGKNSFVIYHDWEITFKMLEPEQLKDMLLAMFAVSKGEKPPEMDKMTTLAFVPIAQQMERDKQKYLERCEKNRQAAESRWNN